MTRIALLSTALTLLLCLTLLPARGAGPADLALLDAPRGSWVATVRADAPLTVVEETAGWRRVRIEGWVAATTARNGAADPVMPLIPPAGASAPAAGRARGGEGASVRGVLLPPPGDPSNKPGSGLLVLLVSDLAVLDAEHARTISLCRADLGAATEALDRLKSEYAKALNASDNFREAATRSDRLKAELAAAAKARAQQVEDCRQKVEGVYQRHTIQRAISDDAGRFEFASVPPGRHRVVATESAGEHPRAWILECAVAGADSLVLDPRQDASPADPFRELR